MKFVAKRNYARFVKRSILLGIETSCDDTAVAVVASDRTILSEVIKGQNQIHSKVKGIIPQLAKEEHQRTLDEAVSEAIRKANVSFADLSAIAVTKGPGLGICLGVGLGKAKMLALEHSKPIVAVNHMEGHALIVRQFHEDVNFPFLTLLVSGGHTMILVCKGVGEYIQLGTTLDDPIGEAFDKVARMLELEWDGGGGKAIEQLATKSEKPNPLSFPEPMSHLKNCNFSFSGIKAAATREMERLLEFGPLDEQTKANFADAFQGTAIQHLLTRVARAITWCKGEIGLGCDTLVVSGGVASNQELSRQLSILLKKEGYRLVVPPRKYCTDNGVMIAWAGIENFLLGKSIVGPEEAQAMRYKPTWKLDPSGTDYFPLPGRTPPKLRKRTE